MGECESIRYREEHLRGLGSNLEGNAWMIEEWGQKKSRGYASAFVVLASSADWSIVYFFTVWQNEESFIGAAYRASHFF